MRILVAILAMAVLLSGCHDEKKTANRDDSLMVVSGHVLTKERADRMLAAQLAVAKNPSGVRRGMIRSIDKKFLMDSLLGDYAKAKGLAVDPNEVNVHLSRLVSHRGGMTKDIIADLREMVTAELTARKVYDDFMSRQKIEIPQAEVRKRRELLARVGREGGASNAVVYASATNCWKKMIAGKCTFKQALAQYDESEGVKDPEGNWGEYSLDAFSEEETQLKTLLPQMKPGDITPPVPGDNGLVIVKLLGVGVNNNNPKVSVPATTYRLARIFFHLYETWTPQTDAELEQDLRDIETKNRWSEFVGGLETKAEIRYADGGNNLKQWKSAANKNTINKK